MTDTPTTIEFIVEGKLLDQSGDMIVLGISGTDYQLHLKIAGKPDVPPSRFVRGWIHSVARRVDVVPAGGRFIEPVQGRPRRIQGVVNRVDVLADLIVVDSIIPITCRLAASQKAEQFEVGRMVSFDVEPDSRFEMQ